MVNQGNPLTRKERWFLFTFMVAIGIAGLVIGVNGNAETGLLGLVTLFTSITMFDAKMGSRKSMKALIVFMLASSILLAILMIISTLGGLVPYTMLSMAFAIIAFMVVYSTIMIRHLQLGRFDSSTVQSSKNTTPSSDCNIHGPIAG